MAKEIIWSRPALEDRRNILKYWILRIKSKLYSVKLDILFKDNIKFISEHPSVGKLTNFENIRAKVVRDYLIFYEEFSTQIHILAIWDSLQNPEKLEKKLQIK